MNESEEMLIAQNIGVAMQTGQPKKALELLEGVLAADPQNAHMLYMKGCALAEIGQEDKAIEAYEESAKHAGEMAALPLYNLGNLYKNRNEFEHAVAAYQATIDVDPANVDAWINMGCVLDDNGHHEIALNCYEAALQLDATDSMAWSNQGNTLRSLGRADEAMQSHAKALELDPNDVGAMVGLGAGMVESGDPDGLELIERAFATTRAPAALSELALALCRLDRHEDAIECFEMLPELNSEMTNNAAYWNNRGECLAKLSRLEEALASFDSSLALQPNFEAALFGKARTLANAERLDDASTVAQQLKETGSAEFLAEPHIQALFSFLNLTE